VTAVLLSFSVVQFDFVRGFYKHNATFREVQDLLAVACFEDIMDEYEFLLFWDLHMSKNLDFPYEDYGDLTWTRWTIQSVWQSLESRNATFQT